MLRYLSSAVAACCLVFVGASLLLAAPASGDANDANDGAAASAYESLVLQDRPVAWWRMDLAETNRLRCTADSRDVSHFDGLLTGAVQTKQPGPLPNDFPLFEKDNPAIALNGAKGFLRIKDPGDHSHLDFAAGDSLTLEAWVQPLGLKEGQQVYIVGKGRTRNPGVAEDNQNYALRLRCIDGTARLSFLFRSAPTGKAKPEFHRWNSSVGIAADSGWHHVAVTYSFGRGSSIRGYLDGKEVQGTWDMGGATDSGPVVDNDELWIGSSMAGNPDSTFVGLIDEVALYREALSAERLSARYRYAGPPPTPETIDPATIPADAVLYEVFEGVTDRSWNLRGKTPSLAFTMPALALPQLPRKYTARGVIDDRSNPFLVRAQMKLELPAGKYRLLLRSLNASRLLVDGQVVAQTDFLSKNASGHEKLPAVVEPGETGLRPLPQGHREKEATIELAAGLHVLRQEFFVGGSGVRLELGEPCVAIAAEQGRFHLLAPGGASPHLLTDDGWADYAAAGRARVQELDQRHRRLASAEEDQYWARRHDQVRELLSQRPAIAVPAPAPGLPAHNAIDHFLNVRLAAAKAKPAPLTDDYAFLRRITLDCRGTLPTREEIAAFVQDRDPNRRQKAIDRLLADEGWADNWVGYWQDVLAENPGIVKPTLNNTGPFRFWIHESLVDNKPLDRFATELALMEGSRYYGGPAGFAMATENDVPLAEKAHVLSKAFLALEMKCARCHDAPAHPFLQRDLFSVAAMLNRQPLTLPKTSTVPALPGGRTPLVSVSLKPGAKLDPAWPFGELADEALPPGLVRDANDPRERLAALMTSPTNDRFAQVAVNRLWKRLLGFGLVEPVDDWTDVRPSHPELLEYLARELALQGYNVKHVVRLILSSHAYQRQVTPEATQPALAAERLFAGQARRRMGAEQIVDSLHAAAGKSLAVESLTLDPEGRLAVQTFLNLGAPRRAWELASISTDRDRPALGLPRAQSVIDLLASFGWRDYRPSPLTLREEEPNVLQPLAVANGLASTRIARLCDANALTALCLADQPVEQLVDQVTLQILSRPPTSAEREQFVALLAPGYEQRKVNAALKRPPVQRHAVSWSNHLTPDATRVKLEIERQVRAGDPPTDRLQADWRERVEDLAWALINSPEFVFLP